MFKSLSEKREKFRTVDGFLDPRNHGMIRIAAIVPRIAVCEPLQNAKNHLEMLERAREQGAYLAVGPELGLIGYTHGDHVQNPTMLQGVLEALDTLVRATDGWNMLITVGMPMVIDDRLYNLAVPFMNGRIYLLVPKLYPPNYGEFQEERYYRRGIHARGQRVRILGQEVPFGWQFLLHSRGFPHLKIHYEICEDGWVPIPPSHFAALAGATVLKNLSASNSTVAKDEYRQVIVRATSGACNAARVYTAAGVGESTGECAWDGSVHFGVRGELVAAGERFATHSTLLVQDIELESLVTARIKQGSFGENAEDFGIPFDTIELDDDGPEFDPPALLTAEQIHIHHHIDPLPFVPSDRSVRDKRCYELFHIGSSALARRLEALPPQKRKIIIELSGGRDSVMAVLISVKALERLGLPRTDAIAVTMRGPGTDNETEGTSFRLINALGIRHRNHPITDICDAFFLHVGHNPEIEDTVFENSQALLRKNTGYVAATQEGGIDLCTADLTEILTGYSTYGADQSGHYASHCGKPKTLIEYVIAWAADVVFKDEPGVAEALASVLKLPVTAGLRRLREGQITQKTDELNGPAPLLDFFGLYLVHYAYPPSKIFRVALQAFAGLWSPADIRKWFEHFLRARFRNEFKVATAPQGVKSGPLSMSPRTTWRVPTDINGAAFLEELAMVPSTEEITARLVELYPDLLIANPTSEHRQKALTR